MNKRPPENQNNVWMAMLLSLAVFLLWNQFYFEPRMREEREKQLAAKRAQTEQSQTTGLPAGATLPGAAVTSPEAGHQTLVRAATREAALKLSARVAIETPSVKGSIALKGGRIDDLSFVKYHEAVDPKSPNIVLFAPSEAPHAYFADYGWTADAPTVAVPTRETLWTNQSGGSLTPTTPVVLTWDNGQGLAFKRTISVDADFMFKVVEEVDNKGTTAVMLRPYSRIFRDTIASAQANYVLHEGLIGFLGEASLIERTYEYFAKKDEKRVGFTEAFADQKGGWIGMTDKYWAAALIPTQTVKVARGFLWSEQVVADTSPKFTAKFTAAQKRTPTEDDQFETRVEQAPITLAAGAKGEASSQLYAGPKIVSLINSYEEKLGILKFSYMIDWGWFYFITKPLFYSMEAINSVLGNFGLTILAITLLLKLLFFPIANASYESMAKMKKLQPQIEDLKVRFKDDKERFAKEQMGLFQREKVNPLAGCLPMLLQIPVFFGLYKVLYGTIDMRHAPFYGWIKDLSAPDPTSMFNLFGALPFDVPHFLLIGVWPLIMGITMWMQMQMNPPPPDPVQAQVFAWMPVMLTFVMASLPVGLVIYWSINNTLTMAQQAIINKRLGVEVHLKDNMIKQWNGMKGGMKELYASLRGSSAPVPPGADKVEKKDTKAK